MGGQVTIRAHQVARRLEDYALLGDTHTAALVHRDGSVDWLCLPRFDSPAVFAALLGTADHGRWRLAPVEPPTAVERRYRGDTLILQTDITTATGHVQILDFLTSAVAGQPSLVRTVVGIEDTVEMAADIRFRFNYGEVAPWVRTVDGAFVAMAGAQGVVLRTPVALCGDGNATTARFTVCAGERVSFVLSWAPAHGPLPAALDPETALADAEAYSLEWSRRLAYDGPYRAPVVRSLLTLKALTYGPTGGIVAAPTTSLPEQIGGPRNWDYRYTWLRDASITLAAFRHSGYVDEAAAWRSWLLRAAYGDPAKQQIMYGVGGERLLPESELPWLPGYAGSMPVRIGNAAAGQLQLDVYGEVISALEEARDAGLGRDDDAWALQCAMVDEVAHAWRQPDQGIWEIRGPPRHFVSSKVMAWVAADRMVRAATRHHLPGPVRSWRHLRDEIRAEILERGYDPVRNTFVQSYGTTAVDGSLLVIPMVGFLPAHDSRVKGTIAAIEEDLLGPDGLVRRYRTDGSGDGLPAGEGAFLACSFWLVDVYILAGRTREAHRLFDRLLALGNDLGLFAEEFDSARGLQLGNFPQAFTHVEIVHTALLLSWGVATGRAAGRWLAPRNGPIAGPMS